jgi:hypothetical protein
MRFVGSGVGAGWLRVSKGVGAARRKRCKDAALEGNEAGEGGQSSCTDGWHFDGECLRLGRTHLCAGGL